MSSTSYKKIFTIKVTHDYFKSSFDENIQFKLGANSVEVNKRFDIRVNKVEGSYNFYINAQLPIAEFLQNILSVTSNDYFDFHLDITNPNFYNYTEIPIDSIVSYVYESNPVLSTLNGEEVILKPKQSTAIINDEFAVIKIYFKDIMVSLSLEPVFLISFTSRATYWQYYLINTSQINLSNPIIKGNLEVAFENPNGVVLENGQHAIEIATKEPLKLSEFPVYKFDLFNAPSEDNNQSGISRLSPKKLFSGLPNPDPANIKIEQGNQKVFSPMYIYI